MRTPRVAVFDIDLPPGVAFLRSFGRGGVPFVAFSHLRHAVGRYSRYVDGVKRCPRVHETDEFTDFLAGLLASGQVDLVAPTSDYVAFAASEAYERLGRTDGTGLPGLDQLRNCLFKDRFASAFERAGFPTPPTEAPVDYDQALGAAERLGYPLVVKPRSHIGVGLSRGVVVRNDEQLRAAFVPYRLFGSQDTALSVDPSVATPVLQTYLDPGATDVVSVTGVLDIDGTPLAVGQCRKVSQWPPRLGVGTLFESLPPPHFAADAVAAVGQVLGRGIFELEVLVDRRSGDHWAIDLNPRGFGQMALDIAAGRDLPLLWYASVGGTANAGTSASRRTPTRWRMGIHYFTGRAVDLASRPGKSEQLQSVAREVAAPAVGPIWNLSDPLPGVVWALTVLRHPGGLVRPFLGDPEMVDSGS